MPRCLRLLSLALALPALLWAKDLRTKEQRLYAVKMRTAQWEVARKELELQVRQGEYEEVRELCDQRLATSDQLNRALAAYQQARLARDQALLSLEETRLSFLRDAVHVSILAATKVRAAEDLRQVELTIENTSQLARSQALDPRQPGDQHEALLALQQLAVSLRNPAGLIIAEPYQLEVPLLRRGERHTLRFTLLEDCQDLVVSLVFPDGHAESTRLALRRETLQDLPQITSPHFSREGELNAKVSYQLFLERLGEDEAVFIPAVLGLPAEVSALFLDPATEAEVDQVEFGPQSSHHHLTLELQLPEALNPQLLDQPLPFQVLVLDPRAYQELNQLRRRHGDQAPPAGELASLRAGSAAFTLVPRGTGELELLTESRAQEIGPGQTARFAVQVVNSGSLDLAGVALTTSLPLGWSAALDPDTLDQLPAGERVRVNLELRAPTGLQGEYELRLSAVGYAGRRRVEAPERELVLRVETPVDWRNVLLVGVGLAVLLGAAVTLRVRWRRR
jgi:hypothetical protein